MRLVEGPGLASKILVILVVLPNFFENPLSLEAAASRLAVTQKGALAAQEPCVKPSVKQQGKSEAEEEEEEAFRRTL